MASKTTNYGLNKHSPQDFYNVEARNENWDKIDEALAAADPTKITAKVAPADGDGVMIADSADGGKAKRLLWSSVKTALGKLFVPLARTVNGKALSADVTLTAADIKMPNSEEDVGAAMAKATLEAVPKDAGCAQNHYRPAVLVRRRYRKHSIQSRADRLYAGHCFMHGWLSRRKMVLHRLYSTRRQRRMVPVSRSRRLEGLGKAVFLCDAGEAHLTTDR